jgi:hypothetical protein
VGPGDVSATPAEPGYFEYFGYIRDFEYFGYIRDFEYFECHGKRR